MSETLTSVTNTFLLAVMAILIVMIFVAFIRTIKGPKITDRIVSVNLIGTITIMIIELLVIYLNESYLNDNAIIYAMISFLAVVVLCKIYLGVYLEKKNRKEKK